MKAALPLSFMVEFWHCFTSDRQKAVLRFCQPCGEQHKYSEDTRFQVSSDKRKSIQSVDKAEIFQQNLRVHIRAITHQILHHFSANQVHRRPRI